VSKFKKFIKKYFQHFYYFYSHLGNRIFISFLLNTLVGIMDGFGLSMFIPLLQMADETSAKADSSKMGNMSFINEFFTKIHVPLNLYSILAIIFFFFFIKGAFRFLEAQIRNIYEQYFIKNIRTLNIVGLTNFSYQKFTSADVGRIQNTLGGEVDKVRSAYRNYFAGLQYLLFIFVYSGLAFFSNPQFAIMVVVGGLLSSLLIQKIKNKTKDLSRKITTDSHSFQGFIIQKANFFKYLKSTGQIENYSNKLIENNNLIQNSQLKLGLITAILISIREPIVITVMLLSILVEVYFFHQNIGLIVFTLMLFYRALISLTGMQNSFNSFFSYSGSLKNMDDFNKELKNNRESDGDILINRFKNSIEIKSIDFAFEETSVLKNINLTIHKNETLAIIGESGSGKTTLINLITGLLNPTKGQIKIDGIDLSTIKKSSFQKRIGYITQEAVIFNDTIFNNVTFWDEVNEKTNSNFEEALKKGAIYDFVMSLPLKGNEILGSNGINISGGQKQRISIARELYKDLDFLFMDEATSALDSDTEKSIKENIESLHGKYTIVIVAHRLSTIKNADRIVLMNKGEIIAIGTFDELIKNPIFNKMVKLQTFESV